MNTEINMVATGGMIGMRRRLGTMTIHRDDASGRYFVTDDRNGGKTISAGWGTADDAERAHKARDDRRLM